MEDQKLLSAIEEGVSKGVPMDFIAYSLVRAGWPRQRVEAAVEGGMLLALSLKTSLVMSEWPSFIRSAEATSSMSTCP